MNYHIKKQIVDYLSDKGYETLNDIKYVKKYPCGDAVISVTILAVGNKEYIGSAMCKTIYRGDKPGQLEMTCTIEDVDDIISLEKNKDAQKILMNKIINRGIYL